MPGGIRIMSCAINWIRIAASGSFTLKETEISIGKCELKLVVWFPISEKQKKIQECTVDHSEAYHWRVCLECYATVCDKQLENCLFVHPDLFLDVNFTILIPDPRSNPFSNVEQHFQHSRFFFKKLFGNYSVGRGILPHECVQLSDRLAVLSSPDNFLYKYDDVGYVI